MRALVLAFALFVSLTGSALAQGGMGPGPGTVHSAGGGGAYAGGPLDIVSGAKFCATLRACSSAIAAAATQPIVRVVRQRVDLHDCDILVAPSGGLGVTGNCTTGGDNGQTPVAFAGVDAAGSATITTGTLNLSGGRIGDSVNGSGVTAGSWITGGSTGAWTVTPSQTVATTTITLSFQLLVSKFYDQTGITTSPTAIPAKQPTLLLSGGPSAALPYIASNGAIACMNSTSGVAALTQPYTMSTVGFRFSTGAGAEFLFSYYGGVNGGILSFDDGGTPGGLDFYSGNRIFSTGITAPAWHDASAVANGASGLFLVDGSSFNGNTGTLATDANALGLGGIGSTCAANQMNGGYVEFVAWQAGLTAPNQASLHSQQRSYWGF